MKVQRVSSLREFDVQNRMRQVQVLIKSKRFDEAEDLLEEIATPDADRLLLRLRKYRLAVEINKPSPQVQQSNEAPNISTPKRYHQLRMLSYIVRIIAFGWACVGISTIFEWSTISIALSWLMAQPIDRFDVVTILLLQAFFIYVLGVALGTLADIAENIAINTALLLDDNANS